MTRLLYIVFFLTTPFFCLSGQIQDRERFFQVTGLITDDNNKPLPNVGVISFKLKRGSLSERTGIYSITSTPGDTIFFRALGFKRKFVIMPDDFEGRHFNLDIVLGTDTIPIENVVVMPWKSYSQFIKDMTSPSPIAPEIENMNRNLASVQSAVANDIGVRISPEAAYRYAMQQNFNMTVTRGQYPVNNLLNPIAWAKFINGMKNGLLRNQPVEKPAKLKGKHKKKKKTG